MYFPKNNLAQSSQAQCAAWGTPSMWCEWVRASLSDWVARSVLWSRTPPTKRLPSSKQDPGNWTWAWKPKNITSNRRVLRRDPDFRDLWYVGFCSLGTPQQLNPPGWGYVSRGASVALPETKSRLVRARPEAKDQLEFGSDASPCVLCSLEACYKRKKRTTHCPPGCQQVPMRRRRAWIRHGVRERNESETPWLFGKMCLFAECQRWNPNSWKQIKPIHGLGYYLMASGCLCEWEVCRAAPCWQNRRSEERERAARAAGVAFQCHRQQQAFGLH